VIGWFLVKTALIIGDSHVEPAGSFGPALAAKLQAQGYAVTVAGVGSTNAHQWATQQVVCRPDKSRCVDQAQLPRSPDLLVISLGTNDAANAAAGGASPAASVADVRRVIDRYDADKYFWIGPPATNDSVPYYTNAAIANYYAAAKASGLSIFDSRGITAPLVAAKLGDGVHLYGSGAQAWADATARGIASQGSYKTKVAFGLATAAILAVLWKKGYI
jgi:lysophospholipase L1-like esterase